jgi:hypothetical protein
MTRKRGKQRSEKEEVAQSELATTLPTMTRKKQMCTGTALASIFVVSPAVYTCACVPADLGGE